MFAIIDRTDLRLIRVLHADARLSVTALAERIGLSPNATAERMRRLQREGVIAGFTLRLDWAALGRGLIAFVEVKLDRTDGEVFDAFAAAVRDVAGIDECHMVAGGFDYLLKTRHADMAAYRAFLADALATLPGVRETRTYVVMEEVVAGGALPG
ncbi:Leucine-responsive regulatory protein [Jannaschia seosinensis]|uniref:Leucine-responsive regulatory protein n=1 Tax=Jannaschia seosinensis TaxID=313367 RepID=A0A0M7BD24_9RHOB|nr:Lrp/AsnC ligand binding domain-containing protein [Jannaschia seosinensis]CUH40640.1 Leucine-responsive regulatory protein [Jannaschia seosinensis]